MLSSTWTTTPGMVWGDWVNLRFHGGRTHRNNKSIISGLWAELLAWWRWSTKETMDDPSSAFLCHGIISRSSCLFKQKQKNLHHVCQKHIQLWSIHHWHLQVLNITSEVYSLDKYSPRKLSAARLVREDGRLNEDVSLVCNGWTQRVSLFNISSSHQMPHRFVAYLISVRSSCVILSIVFTIPWLKSSFSKRVKAHLPIWTLILGKSIFPIREKKN